MVLLAWDLGPFGSRVLGPPGSSRVLGPCFPACRNGLLVLGPLFSGMPLEKESRKIPQRGPAKWRVTVYDVIFGELMFLDSHTT